MSGAVWATVAGVGFGLFQSVNRQAVRGLDVWQSTFLQLAVSSVVLLAGTLATEDLSQLRAVSPVALAAFLGAGLIHFCVGWTLLNASQKRIGAARTSPLLAATPLFGTILAAVTLGEVPGAVTVLAIALIVAGVYVTVGTGAASGPRGTTATGGSGGAGAVGCSGGTTAPGGSGGAGTVAAAGLTRASWRGSLFGLGTAACWAISPLLIREGLAQVPSPGLGVTISMLAAGVLVGLSTWTRWEALALSPVAVVLALGLLSVPTVILVAPPLAGRQEEPITARILLGATLVVAGSLFLVVRT